MSERVDADLLAELGLDKAALKVRSGEEFIRRSALAYEHFAYVKPEHIDAFNKKLKSATTKRWGTKNVDLHEKYDQLVFTPLQKYGEIPPMAALTKLKEAKERNIFTHFEVCKVESVVEYKDPIIFGRVKVGKRVSPDFFHICEWDTDVSLDDIVKCRVREVTKK